MYVISYSDKDVSWSTEMSKFSTWKTKI